MEFRIPKSFKEKYKKLLGEEYEELLNCLKIKPRKSIRVNTIKISVKKLIKRLRERGWKLEKIPWVKEGFFVKEPEDIARSLEYFLGYYYIQEGSSMIPPLILDPKPEDRILDLCAAPGSKTTQMAAMMKNKGIIVANDDSVKRIKALCMNLQKCGIKNCIVTITDGRKFWRKGLKFNKILLDVPCSGSGTIISSYSVFETWSPYIVFRLSKLQKQLLKSAVRCLEKDGIIVYSTCSMDPEENEDVIDFGVKKLGLEVEEVKLKGVRYREGIIQWNKKKFNESVSNAIRIYPHDNLTEGFFICRLRR